MEWKYSYQLLQTNALVLKQHEKAEEEMAAQLLEGAFLMEEDEAAARLGEVCGRDGIYYAAWQKKEMVGLFALEEEEKTCYVFDFAVDGAHKRRGIGKALLKEISRLVQTKGAGADEKKVRIQVGSRNETAFRLYQKNGFQVISQRDYYLVNMKAM